MIVFDATILLLAMFPDKVSPPIDDTTGKPVTFVKERIDAFIDSLEKDKKKIILPCPALSEMLVQAGKDADALISTIKGNNVFKIYPFDIPAAYEVAMMTRSALDDGDKKGGIYAPWQKIKYDRQIVAIAKVNRASIIYTDDPDIKSIAKTHNIETNGIADLPVPTKKLQQTLALEDKDIEEEQKPQTAIEAAKDHEEKDEKERSAETITGIVGSTTE